MNSEYKILEKTKSELQKVLNQWKHTYRLIIIWIEYNNNTNKYHILIERVEK